MRPLSRIYNGPRPARLFNRSLTNNADQSWFRIVNADPDTPPTLGAPAPTVAEVWVYDEIGLWGITAMDFVQQLRAVQADAIDLHLNSPGGDVFDGLAIYNAVRAHPAPVTGYVDGLAASIASVIAMACDRLLIAPNASMMVHDAWGVCVGPAADMLTMAQLLDTQSNNIAGIYNTKAGQGVKTWRARMQTESWYGGQEAVDAKLADGIAQPGQASARMPNRQWDLTDAVREGHFRYAGRATAPAPELPQDGGRGAAPPPSGQAGPTPDGTAAPGGDPADQTDPGEVIAAGIRAWQAKELEAAATRAGEANDYSGENVAAALAKAVAAMDPTPEPAPIAQTDENAWHEKFIDTLAGALKEAPQ